MNTLRHEIDTSATDADAWAINDICAKVREDHPDAMIGVNDDRMFLRIRARCNGAALRDLIFGLDTAGFLA